LYPKNTNQITNMKLLAVSDWRVQDINLLYEALDARGDIDAIVYAGDGLDRFHDGDTNHLAELGAVTTAGDVFAVRGNDDSPSTTAPIFEASNVHDVHDEPYVIEDTAFIGQEGSLENTPGHILYAEDEIETHLIQQFEAVSEASQVCLISHTPPFGTLDYARRLGQRSIGSHAVADAITTYAPTVVVCGHCHLMGGRTADHSHVPVLNIACHDDAGADARYATIDLSTSGPEITTGTLPDTPESELLRLAQVGYSRLRHMQEQGIVGLDDITQANRQKLIDLPGSSAWHADRWLAQADAIRTDTPTIYNPENLSPIFDDPVLLFDLETDLNQEQVFLAGFYDTTTNSITQFFNADDEEELLADLRSFVTDYNDPTLIYYGGNNFDETRLEHSLSTHGFDSLKSQVTYWDLGIYAQQEFFGDFPDYRLESIAATINGWTPSSDLDGFVVGLLYTKYKNGGREPDWDELQQYNQEDLQALNSIVEFVTNIE
jgi:Icc-related predicted phosphoesterase/uncharacterized protein YprB with RNaseH-like and TPR domain